MEVSFRRRINVATSVKGIKTFDCTVESENSTLEALLDESDNMVAALERRYPPQIGG